MNEYIIIWIIGLGSAYMLVGIGIFVGIHIQLYKRAKTEKQIRREFIKKSRFNSER